ncbi:MAG: bifunctional alpha,alpha-trehalose-phosphate synthase (UDP-forming)/trehalose-phosphatase [Dehalococcoidia bacterium CG2_30_46_19]|nr:MAG: bifunctional alpha,alpha-trehalose-phosphate synthase (UDP-forming)/trehalose-phosphatase [Dehalococcoidia bacterium CG2_30_46_19]
MRLLVVSNRLPFTVIEKRGRLELTESAGGLVSGLSAYLDSLRGSSFASEYIWVAWPGSSISDENKEKLKLKLAEFRAYPVFISEDTMEKFYHGFCNKTLWPLFHYFPSYAMYDEDYWLHYKKVNETFCDAITEITKPEDVVWIHDYHLMLLPKLLREKRPNLPIGFFLHIPFPTFEIFRLLPGKWRSEILNGILGADLIGFHTHDYAEYFLRCVLRILGYEHNMGKIITEDRVVKVDTFPMGIDFKKFYDATNSIEVHEERSNLKKSLGVFKVILSIDRLDYTKGIINRLQGYEIFLEKNQKWHGKVILVVVVVPSRIEVEHYRQMKRQIDELVGKINGRFGRIGWTPILYQYRFLPFNKLVSLYNISDVALITPLRDGMNLIAKEYISTRTDKTGVLILSEMAGASSELVEAIIINPNNREEIANALKEALEMSDEEQMRRIQSMQARLKRYDVSRWANEFIQNLISVKEEQKRFFVRLLDSHKEQLLNDFKKANQRLIFLDYDGTLVPFTETPQKAKPDAALLKILKHLSVDEKNEIILISGRDRNTLQSWFGMLNIAMIAEHGAWIKEKGGDWRMIKPLRNDWKPQILSVLEIHADRLPGSFVEEKEFSLVFHYRKADPELASIRTKELTGYLINFTANIDVQVLQGSKIVEIRNSGVNKGAAALHWISKNDFDFILAIGDDWTDEDLFRILPETAYSIKVGITQSHAKYNLHNHMEVRELLSALMQ